MRRQCMPMLLLPCEGAMSLSIAAVQTPTRLFDEADSVTHGHCQGSSRAGKEDNTFDVYVRVSTNVTE